MDSKVKIILSALFVFSTLVFFSCENRKNNAGKPEKPNIILIMADDMGFSDLGFMGSGVQTPNIDRLASNGIVFNQFYNAGRCCPTRASLLTGLYAHNTDLGWMTASDFGRPGYLGAISQNCVTLGQVLKSSGYANYVIGKWHVVYDPNMVADGANHNWPMQRGFDKYFGMLSGGGGYYTPNTLTYNNERLIPDDDFYLTQAFNDSTVGFLEQHFATKKEQPFFLYLAHYAPHRPLHALQEDIQKYKGKFDQGWDAFRQKKLEKMKSIGLAEGGWLLSDRPDNIPAWETLNQDEKAMWEKRMEVYAAQIDRMDQGIGRLIETLEDNNQLDNTLILFLSDNGGNAEVEGKDFDADKVEDVGGNTFNQSYRRHWANMSNTPFREYKSNNHEGGISTPLIVHWPDKIKKPSISNQQGHVIDIMPTLIELTGAKYPTENKGNTIKPFQGKSLLSAFYGETFDRGAMFFEHEADRAIIEGNWKLVAPKGQEPLFLGKWELYDLSVDRAESNNLINEYPDIAAKLEEKWDTWAEENNVLPLDGRGWSVKVKTDVNR